MITQRTFQAQSVKSPMAGVRSPLKGPGSSRVLDVLSCYLRLLVKQTDTKLILKPQDSFGEFNNFFLDLQKVQGIIRKHH